MDEVIVRICSRRHDVMTNSCSRLLTILFQIAADGIAEYQTRHLSLEGLKFIFYN